MLRMHIKCISTKSFDETCTMHPKSKQVEFYMGSDTENVINTLFNTLLQNFQRIPGADLASSICSICYMILNITF